MSPFRAKRPVNNLIVDLLVDVIAFFVPQPYHGTKTDDDVNDDVNDEVGHAWLSGTPPNAVIARSPPSGDAAISSFARLVR